MAQLLCTCLLAILLAGCEPSNGAGDLEETIAAATGMETSQRESGAVRVSWSRTAVTVEVDGRPLPPAAGLTSWAAFKPSGGGAVAVAGDMVVFEDEISPVMDAAFAHGLEVTALHNHFTFAEPPVFFLHIGGRGDPAALGEGVKAIRAAIADRRAQRAEPADVFPESPHAPTASEKPDPQAIGEILGVEPAVKTGGVVKVSFPRDVEMDGVEAGGAMGVASWAAFVGSGERASVDGDFAMTGEEVQPVLRALRAGGIHVVALHNHMIGDKPRLYFAHFWGRGTPEDLARAIDSARRAQTAAE